VNPDEAAVRPDEVPAAAAVAAAAIVAANRFSVANPADADDRVTQNPDSCCLMPPLKPEA
jgi:hypothetical protein